MMSDEQRLVNEIRDKFSEKKREWRERGLRVEHSIPDFTFTTPSKRSSDQTSIYIFEHTDNRYQDIGSIQRRRVSNL